MPSRNAGTAAAAGAPLRELPERERLACRFAALSNPVRLELLELLLDAETEAETAGVGRTITDLAARAELSRFTASRHLAILRHAGLAAAVHEGRRQLHRIDREGLARLDDWLYPYVIDADAVGGAE
jgi:DNA-binding transcriptional ArsR family regulator